MNMRKMLAAVSTVVLLITSGCATGPINTAESAAESGGSLMVYPMSREAADLVLQQSIKAQFPDQTIMPIGNGYRVYVRFLLDSHYFIATMVPARGTMPSGEVVDGYYFDVNQFGTMLISGKVRAGNLLEKITANANGVAKPIPMVISVLPIQKVSR